MAVELQALKAAPRDDARASELIAECRAQLGGEWTLISSSAKMRKTIFEADFDGRRVIGKASRSKRSKTAYGSLLKLRDAGMRPPSAFTVPEPIVWFEECMLLVQEKAAGVSVLDAMQHDIRTAAGPVRRAAAWLNALSQLGLEAREDRLEQSAVRQRAAELGSALNDSRVERLASIAFEIAGNFAGIAVPSHGDYHPMNIFVSADCVTAIDLDTLALRDRESDVAYFLAQIANFGLMMFDSFDATRPLREVFLREFSGIDRPRVAAHMGWTLLQSLHFDVCILKIHNDKTETMIRAAETLLETGSLDPVA